MKFLGAVEVSLEENRAERGNIGYVDMQTIFHLFPQTQKAKENFEEVVRQAEDQINLRKSELISLRAEIAQLKAERDYLSKNPAAVPDSDASTENPPPLPGTEPQAQPHSKETPVPKDTLKDAVGDIVSPSSSTAAPALSTAGASGSLSQIQPAISTASTSNLFPQIQPPSTSTQPATTANSAPPAVSTGIVSAIPSTPPMTPTVPGATPALTNPRNLPGISPEGERAAGNQPARSAGATTLAELDQKIADKTKLLENKESEFKTYQAQVEKNLLDLESRRTEILLGKIYEVVQQVARDEGVSVVVDKSQILFGHKAVDLTPKVLQKLKSL